VTLQGLQRLAGVDQPISAYLIKPVQRCRPGPAILAFSRHIGIRVFLKFFALFRPLYLSDKIYILHICNASFTFNFLFISPAKGTLPDKENWSYSE
jgi:hypothetical protein